jgi:glycerol-3-phosphate dehydrogenase
MKRIDTRVIVIGGGATGAGILRDCALRGIAAVLIEKNDIASGATGRNHGLLHSGARYAVVDPESAVECIAENRILKRVARHCIEDTGGLFVTLPGDDPDYHDRLQAACRRAGIPCESLSPAAARALEPNLNPAITRAMRVPDATIDPFRLASANVLDAAERGQTVLTHTRVVKIFVAGDRAVGVLCRSTGGGEPLEVRAEVIVNAAGAWGQSVCRLAGVDLPMYPSKGSMVIVDYRVNSMVINRCREPADGDIIVPGDTVSLIGTTSRKISHAAIDALTVDEDEIDVLLVDGERLIPNVSRTRVLRAYSGVRPLVASGTATRGRDISRGIVVIDHAERDGLQGLISVAGGKLMTYRRMAELAVDGICRKLGAGAGCSTARVPLPGSEQPSAMPRTFRQFGGIPRSVVGSTHYRHGERVHRILSGEKRNFCLICECEMVTAGEVDYALERLHVMDLVDLRRRTRLGMGPCQGGQCAYRAAGMLAGRSGADHTGAAAMLIDFLEERWKGIKPVLWGDSLREAEFNYWIYQGLFGLGSLKDRKRMAAGDAFGEENGKGGTAGDTAEEPAT